MVDPAVGREPSGSGLGLYQARAGLVNQFTLETCGVASSEFDVIVTSPQGEAVPVRCYQQKYANLLAEFTPTSTGEEWFIFSSRVVNQDWKRSR